MKIHSRWTWLCGAVLALGTAIPAVALLFAGAVLWKPLGVPDQDALVRLGISSIRHPGSLSSVSFPQMRDLFDRAKSLEGVAAWSTTGASYVPIDSQPTEVRVDLVTPNYFGVVGVPIRFGRALGGETERLPAVVASARFARRHFAESASVVGRTIRLNDALVVIVGVTSEDFAGFRTGGPADLFLDFAQAPDVLSGTFHRDALTSRSWNILSVVGRIAPGHTQESLRSELDARATYASQSIDPSTHRIGVFPAYPRVGSDEARLRAVSLRALAVAAALCGLVILNLAALVLIRAERRSAEFSIRRVLGASRASITSRLLLDLLGASIIGVVLGSVAAWLIVTLLANDAYAALRMATELRGGWRLSMLVAGACGGIVLLAAAIVIAGWRPPTGSRGEYRNFAATHTPRRALTPWLVAGQFAASMLVLYPAAKATEQLVELLRVEIGVSRSDARVLELSHKGVGEEAMHLARAQGLLSDLRGHTSVAHAALATMVPLGHRSIENAATLSSGPRAGEEVRFLVSQVSDQFFAAAGIRLVDGRDFSPGETRRVAIVSRVMAERFWPASTPIGATLAAHDGEYEIIGVAADVRYFDPFEAPLSVVYVPLAHAQFAGWTQLVAAPAPGQDGRLADALREHYAAFSPSRAMPPVLTIGERIAAETAAIRLAARTLELLAALTLIMAAMSAYAALTQYVLQRRREMGLRKALGACDGRLYRGLIWRACAMALFGLGTGAIIGGVALALLPTQWLGAFDPGLALMVGAVALAAASMAGLGPARRASSVAPQTALRDEW